MILAGMGGVLIAPLFTLTDYVFTLVVLGLVGGGRARRACDRSRSRSPRGLALGVIQNLVAGYSDDVLPTLLSNLSG